ncbi:hypothetical protein SAMN05216227_101171 [Pseudorhodobacter antarcticus]|uniref:Uncharacterized protein n=1 Tax=Pseudorhodobacter antarcticus TaxID=1077947 RepID=A0A1H8FQ19_9RHOB|nr:hypothetical protein [Pseudorhodobacter antarcticus]SEN33208.1 hypothetical protein SAMN05216227_101171 [Pseudorhodobacter antarcticus]
MKNIVAASTIFVLLAGAASAASNVRNERPDFAMPKVSVEQAEQVKADTLYTPKELQRAGRDANDLVTVTVFPSTGKVDGPSLGG